MRLFLFWRSCKLLQLILLAGCGYHWNPRFPNTDLLSASSLPTVSVPYVIGDGDGSLTGEIIRSLAISGLAKVRQTNADYRLQVAILQSDKQNIGYRRDRQKISGESKKNLVACEGRRIVAVEATLYQGETKEIARGPFQIEASSDYDYVDGDSIQDLTFISPKGAPIIVLPFSLGQLESRDAAEEAAARPLNIQIARKILDVIFSQW